jgi:hypothetical protein
MTRVVFSNTLEPASDRVVMGGTIAGAQLFQDVAEDIALRLVETKVFEAGCVVLRYEVVSA